MAQPTPARSRVCRDCDGFPTVAVSSDLGRDNAGHLHVIKVTCRTCKGSGVTSVRTLARVGVTA
ncbi:hypothetical protein ACOKM3_23965 [Streptomyces sp. BH106]|uniref:hypothetical protein n=1 Tax=Streptomyces sp. BH106 TaxID=3410409 RepID=UPI003CF5D176